MDTLKYLIENSDKTVTLLTAFTALLTALALFMMRLGKLLVLIGRLINSLFNKLYTSMKWPVPTPPPPPRRTVWKRLRALWRPDAML